jgi:hypothetical protein
LNIREVFDVFSCVRIVRPFLTLPVAEQCDGACGIAERSRPQVFEIPLPKLLPRVFRAAVKIDRKQICIVEIEPVSLTVVFKEIVSVEVGAEGRKLVFGDVVVRVHENFAAAMHIDTEESNAAGLTGTVDGTIIK